MAEATAPAGDASFLSRYGGSRVWGDTGEGRNPFGRRSSMESAGDDLEALKWAALEKLPTYDRLNAAIISENLQKENEGSRRSLQEIMDLRHLNPDQRARLVELAFKTNEQDNERLLKNIDERLTRVGIEHPTVEVRFEHLSVNADVYVGSRALPNLINFVRNFVENLLASCKLLPSNKREFNILNDVSGVVQPGRMTLLLGPPGAGKTTLLLALAGKLGSDLRKTGVITFNGHEMHEFVPQRTAAYVSQNDNHIGELTVRETLDFAARVQGVGYKHDMLIELAHREKEQHIHPDPDIDAFMKVRNDDMFYIFPFTGKSICLLFSF
jgi:ABC-type multidrug transport system fused ATPase/permease subunit